jgi:hypothetical protein
MTDPIRADRVKAEKVSWLWRERIPYGMLSVVAGRPDQGKGLFAAHVAAEASRKGIRVLYSAAEDSHGLMTRPRLEAAEAKLENIHLARFTLPRDFTWLTEQVVKHRTRLIIIDPLASHLGGGVSRHSDNIRTVTGPLAALAERTNCAVIIVEHALKKVGAGSHPLNAIGGSGSGLPAAARIAYLFGADPDDPDRRILAVAKCNIREKPEAIAFESRRQGDRGHRGGPSAGLQRGGHGLRRYLAGGGLAPEPGWGERTSGTQARQACGGGRVADQLPGGGGRTGDGQEGHRGRQALRDVRQDTHARRST